MRLWTHDELHALMDNNTALRTRSDEAHALPRASLEEKERGKLKMMEIYAEAVDCKNINSAKEWVRTVFECLRQRVAWDLLRNQYAKQKLCHSPSGNDYMCFCWVRFSGKIVSEDETGITLATTDGSDVILKHKEGDYRKDKDGNVEVRIGSYAEFIKGCGIKKQ